MPINEEQLLEFIAAYQKEYGIILTIEQAKEEAAKLLSLYRFVYLGR